MEDPLVRRARDREHAADERREEDARDAEVPEDRLLGLPSGESTGARASRERAQHVAGPDVHGAGDDADDERDEEERDRRDRPAGRDAADADRSPVRRPPPTGRYCRPSR